MCYIAVNDTLSVAVIRLSLTLERFSIECRKTKTTLANRNRCKQHNEPIRIRSKYM